MDGQADRAVLGCPGDDESLTGPRPGRSRSPSRSRSAARSRRSTSRRRRASRPCPGRRPGRPGAAIVAMRLPSRRGREESVAARARRSTSLVVVSTIVASGAAGIAGDHHEAIGIDPDGRRRDDGTIDRDLEGRPGARVDEHDADRIAARRSPASVANRPPSGSQAAKKSGPTGALPVGSVALTGRHTSGIAEMDGVARRGRAVGQDGGQHVGSAGRDPGRVALGQLDRDPSRDDPSQPSRAVPSAVAASAMRPSVAVACRPMASSRNMRPRRRARRPAGARADGGPRTER